MLIFNLWHKKEKKKISGYKTIQTFTKRIEDKANDEILKTIIKVIILVLLIILWPPPWSQNTKLTSGRGITMSYRQMKHSLALDGNHLETVSQ